MLSHVCQAPLSMGFSRQEHWSGLPFPPPGDLPDPGTEPGPPALQADSLLSEPPAKPQALAKSAVRGDFGLLQRARGTACTRPTHGSLPEGGLRARCGPPLLGGWENCDCQRPPIPATWKCTDFEKQGSPWWPRIGYHLMISQSLCPWGELTAGRAVSRAHSPGHPPCFLAWSSPSLLPRAPC